MNHYIKSRIMEKETHETVGFECSCGETFTEDSKLVSHLRSSEKGEGAER